MLELLVLYVYACRSPFPSQQFKCCEPGCEVRFFLREDLSLHYRSFHREAALLEWHKWWDRVEAPSSPSGGLRHPVHPHWAAEPPEPGYCSRIGRPL